MSSSFDATSTAAEVAAHLASSIKGKNVIVTGVSLGGLGAEAARVIASNGAGLVVLAGRGLAKLDEVEASILAEAPKANLRKLVIDLASIASVRKAAAEVNAYPENIDVLINNAAIMACPYAITTDGFESQFGTNHLGPFLFTNLIKTKITASASPRIVNVSSAGHRLSEIRFDDVGSTDGKVYHKWAAYGQGKTANMLFSVSLADKLAKDGVTAFSLHPGVIKTNLGRDMVQQDYIDLGAVNPDGTPSDKLTWKTIGQGAATHIVAAFDPSIKSASGSYLLDCQLHNDDAKPYALDPANAEKLWILSEELVGLSSAATGKL